MYATVQRTPVCHSRAGDQLEVESVGGYKTDLSRKEYEIVNDTEMMLDDGNLEQSREKWWLSG